MGIDGMLAAQQHVQRIWADYCNGSARVQATLQGAIAAVEKGFSREGHFIFEFIQNAEDSGARGFECVLETDTVVIRNDGLSLIERDVDSLCSIGHSSKSPEHYIGHLGVGFKSVFLISEDIEINSGDYNFAFRRGIGDELPWQIAPIWTSGVQLERPWKTEFRIRLRNVGIRERLAQELSEKSLNRRVLLFLDRLKSLELLDTVTGHRRSIRREPSQGKVSTLTEISGDETISERWLIYNSDPLLTPDAIRDDWFTKNWDRDKTKHRAVSIAFKLGDAGELEEIPGAVHMGVFSYLPVREEPSRLNFLIHGDFLTSVGRTRIQDDAPWNRWMAKEILEFAKAKAGDILESTEFGCKAYDVLHPKSELSSDFLSIHVERPFRAFLENDVRLLAHDGSMVSVRDSIVIDGSDVSKLLSPSEVERLYGKTPLARDMSAKRLPKSVPRLPQLATGRDAFLVSASGVRYLSRKADERDLLFFHTLYEQLSSQFTSKDSFETSDLRHAKLVLSRDWSLKTAKEVYFQPTSLPIEYQGEFDFVHPSCAEHPDVTKFLKRIGVETLAEEVLLKGLIPILKPNWGGLNDVDRRVWLRRFKKLVECEEIAEKDISFVTVPTKSGKWVSPAATLFPSELGSEYSIEKLVTDGLLPDPSLEFVASNLIESPDPIEPWKRFLRRLGVDKRVGEHATLTKWSQIVGVEMAKRYEIAQGRGVIAEVTESEKGVLKSGYDLLSSRTAGDDERLIEAKGTKGPGEFTLLRSSIHQILRGERRDRFFVYVTSSALTSPRLHVIRGSELTEDVLLEIGSVKLSLSNLQGKVSEERTFDQISS